ncbi:MAG: spore maturation protein [Lachnospiraceae bacterium]|nr:spore maturation protein [Lachnospiraceae bacterium]
MKLVSYLSMFLIPLVIFYIIVYALLMKKPVFELFLKGAKQGLITVAEIAPSIIGLLVAVGIFRSSGALDLICKGLASLKGILPFPIEVIPLAILKMFSSSGANALLFDIYRSYGTDSYIGFTASLLLCCTETLFYTISIYFTSVQIKKTRWVIPAGIFLALVSLILSAWVAQVFIS